MKIKDTSSRNGYLNKIVKEGKWMVKEMKVCITNTMSSNGEGVECREIERVKHSILRWFGHIERMPGN